MSSVRLTDVCNITCGRLDSNASEIDGKYPYFTCAPEPLRINTYAFDDDVILLAGNNAAGNFHCQRYIGKFNAYQRTYVITAKTGYNIDYIYYNLLINLKHLKKIAQGSQTKFLTIQILNSFLIENIDYDKQLLLASILKNIDNKVNNNNKTIQTLESLAKTIYDYWFLQFEFPNEEGKPYKSSGGKMVWSEELKREIPEGWEVKKLGEIFNFVKGKIPNDSLSKEMNEINSTPYITIDVANGGIAQYCNPDGLIKLDGETIMVMDGAASGDVYVGNKGILGSTFSKLSPTRKDISDRFVYQILNSNKVIYKKANTGSTVPHANSNFIRAMKLPLPKNCNFYSKTFNSIGCNITSLKQQNQQLSSLRDWLLPTLMNGQVTFKETSHE